MAGAKAVERGWLERRVVEVVSVGLWRWPCGSVGLLQMKREEIHMKKEREEKKRRVTLRERERERERIIFR